MTLDARIPDIDNGCLANHSFGLEKNMNHGEHGEHGELKDCSEELIDKVLTAATKVHRVLGPGLLESVYELALMVELAKAGIPSKRQVEIPVIYEGDDLGIGFRVDIIVDECLPLEIKAIENFEPIHLAIFINYLGLLRFKRGFMFNFHKKLLKDGIKRVSI